MPEAKLSKKAVDYRPAATPSRRCGNCSMFLPLTLTCTLVEGRIRRLDVCDRWEKRRAR